MTRNMARTGLIPIGVVEAAADMFGFFDPVEAAFPRRRTGDVLPACQFRDGWAR